jgi:transposase-like protein
MIDLNKIIKNLSKEQKEELLKILNTEAMDSSTDKVIYCPKCGSFHLVKNGKAKGHQRFICCDCGTHFTEYKNTIFNLTKKNIQLWKSYIKMMFDGYTIKQIANELNICIQTSFRWRHKILSVLESKFMNDTLSGIVEVDETLILFSHKGKKIDGVKGRKRGGVSKFRGQSHEQKGILVAVDRKHNVISEVYGNGKISTQNVRDILSGRIESKSVLVADGSRAYNEFAKQNNFELIKLVNEHKKGIYHINNVNNYHSLLKEFLRGFKGISTKYLTKYLAWYKFINQKNDVNYLFNELIMG